MATYTEVHIEAGRAFKVVKTPAKAFAKVTSHLCSGEHRTQDSATTASQTLQKLLQARFQFGI